jgi:glyoxalase family protein
MSAAGDVQELRLEGINHVSAITADAPLNVDFYTGVLGLRLVTKTVNQDDPTVYHLFYGDEEGSAGADMTFFEYPGAARGLAGAGMAHRVLWRVGSRESLAFWAERFAELEVPRTVEADAVRFADPEGLEHELRVDDVPDAPLRAFHPDIPAEHALLGFSGVRVYSLREDASRGLLERVLGATDAGDGGLELRGHTRGGTIAFDAPPEGRALPGAGTIHHVAWGTTVAEHPLWHEHLHAAGIASTPIIDRHFFHSIYFREPGGVLYEIADDGPGFAHDVALAELGRRVVLPPWLEDRRAVIQADLTPLPDPRAGWPQGSAAPR